MFEELCTVLQDRVLEHDHVLGKVLYEGEEAPLGVVPRVRAELLLERLQALDHARYPKLIVPFGAVQSPARTEELYFINDFTTAFAILHLVTLARWQPSWRPPFVCRQSHDNRQ